MTRAAAKTGTSYRLGRTLFLRLLGLIYAFAFLAAARQFGPLIGAQGLLPVGQFLNRVSAALPDPARYLAVPSLFWIGHSDAVLSAAAWTGVALSLAVAAGFADAPILFAMWALYASFVHVGQLFYGYGWEMMMIEAGFLAIFIAPPLEARLTSAKDEPPRVLLWLVRWMLFRVMFGAGMIKLRGDACWRDLTCLYYHFETQPIPNPLSWYFAHLPHAVLRAGVSFNHVAELIAPWFALCPGPVGACGALVIGVFQLMLILSGNLSWLNWLTLALCVPCFDDKLLTRLLPARFRSKRPAPADAPAAWRIARWTIVAVVLALSVNPTLNLFSSRQVMNGSFDPIGLVNTYGAFGSVGKERYQVIVEGTRDAAPDAGAHWTEYEFKCQPGDVDRRPCLVSPYHERLDWQMWFAAMSDYANEPWFVHFVAKLLAGDPGALSLLAENPFPGAPPRYIRAELYRYRFTGPGDRTKAWWARERLGPYMPAISLDNPSLADFLRAYGWAQK